MLKWSIILNVILLLGGGFYIYTLYKSNAEYEKQKTDLVVKYETAERSIKDSERKISKLNKELKSITKNNTTTETAKQVLSEAGVSSEASKKLLRIIQIQNEKIAAGDSIISEKDKQIISLQSQLGLSEKQRKKDKLKAGFIGAGAGAAIVTGIILIVKLAVPK